MFWGCFSKMGLGPLVVLEGSQNKETYLKLLKEYVIPEIEVARELSEEEILFMHDNAPCHTATSISDFLKEEHIKVLNWTPQSPDLNRIENLWAWIKRKHENELSIP
jgi:transposase